MTGKGENTVQEGIRNFLTQMTIGPVQSYKNLSVFPLTSHHTIEVDYITLDEALDHGVIEVAEVSESGSVPELKVMNNSPWMVLILDGEELIGAKQNRIVNTSILVHAGSTTVIPVSCVEQGRWHYKSARFKSHKRMMSPRLRAMKSKDIHESVRCMGTYCSDQRAIWDEISAMSVRLDTVSPTMAMADMYDTKDTSIQDYVKHFKQIDNQVGAVFAINGTVVGMDCFGKPATFGTAFNKLTRSYALDAIDRLRKHKGEMAGANVAKSFLEAFANTDAQCRPSIAAGTDVRIQSESLTGFALAFDNNVLHLAVFAMTGADQ